MSALEEITQAIGELTQLRDEASPGQRGVSANAFDPSDVSLCAVKYDADGDFRSDGRIAQFDGPHFERAREDGLLIATLHRTIDAQLAILRDARGIVQFRLALGFEPGTGRDQLGLTLARAINGGAS